MKLVYSEEAVADLLRLRTFIAEKDPLAAARVATELLARIENLRLFPTMGRRVEAAPDPKAIRDAIFGKYLIRYTTHSETVVILRIWHHYEDRVQST
ncbi:type II toxin-antitoxin system RelE/ParE family toxin [Phytopseudomonas dryadis]|uniref:Plasmid stabilization protein n=1 Tax=Phytopseudomonas dryadis TaxID=2487520 RepID=A0A4Q9QYL4_9GAMM|nr:MULTISPECIES: type II toxin-antitoxin system RelE/ParE family toxin [Pseudomonas]TBU89243.1 plasmid stabilization protein [Pseudomonas dryadis]TBV00763.1 plasmid stabilization protein [Pseudomonas dryadis]TBV13314.1 plasmid stabilization protein [Pseudomonas sp. FRB 230]